MSSIPNINWNDPNNGKSNTSRQSQPQPQLPSNVSPLIAEQCQRQGQ